MCIREMSNLAFMGNFFLEVTHQWRLKVRKMEPEEGYMVGAAVEPLWG